MLASRLRLGQPGQITRRKALKAGRERQEIRRRQLLLGGQLGGVAAQAGAVVFRFIRLQTFLMKAVQHRMQPSAVVALVGLGL